MTHLDKSKSHDKVEKATSRQKARFSGATELAVANIKL